MGFGNSAADIVVSTPLRTAIGTFGGALKNDIQPPTSVPHWARPC